MHSLIFWDVGVIILYLAAITLIGSHFYQRQSSMREYLLGSGRMGWFPVSLSILAADTSAISYLGFPAWSFQHDMKLSQNSITYLLALPIVIGVFLPAYSRFSLYTAYEYLERRFNLAIRIVGTVFFMLMRAAHVAIVIYAPALMMSELTNLSLKWSIVAMGLLTAVYTSLGGIKSVIWTDAIQVGMVFLGFGILIVSVLHNIPGGISTVAATGAAYGKWSLADFSFHPARTDNFWAIVIGGTFLNIQGLSADQAVLQKYFTTGSAKETAKSLIFYGVLIIPMVFLLSALGVMLFTYYSLHPELRETLRNVDAVVPHYAAHVLPFGLTGIVLASIFAGSMSTVSASLNSLATCTVIDIYRRCICPARSDHHYTSMSRWCTAGWGALATAFAFYADRLGSLLLSFTKVQSLIGGIVLGIFAAGVLSRTANARGVALGSIVGLAVVAYLALFTQVSMFWYSVAGSLTTAAASWALSSRSKTKPAAILTEG